MSKDGTRASTRPNGGQDKVVAFGREGHELEPPHRRPTSILRSLLLAAAPSWKMMYTVIALKKTKSPTGLALHT